MSVKGFAVQVAVVVVGLYVAKVVLPKVGVAI